MGVGRPPGGAASCARFVVAVTLWPRVRDSGTRCALPVGHDAAGSRGGANGRTSGDGAVLPGCALCSAINYSSC